MTGSRIVVGLLGGSLAVGLLFAGTGGAAAQNSSSGSGLSPFATESGNDRSAGVNNGNYRPPRFYGPGAIAAPRGYGRQVYGREVYGRDVYDRPVYGTERRRPEAYYGYPY